MKKKLFSFFIITSVPFAVGAKSSFPSSFTEYSAMMQSINIFISEMNKSPNVYYRLQGFGFGVGDDHFGNERYGVGINFLTSKDCFGMMNQIFNSRDCDEYFCESLNFHISRCPE